MFSNVLNLFSIYLIICISFAFKLLLIIFVSFLFKHDVDFFTHSPNDIIFNIVIILYVFNWSYFFFIKIGFEEFILVKSVRLSLTTLSHLTSDFIGMI